METAETIDDAADAVACAKPLGCSDEVIETQTTFKHTDHRSMDLDAPIAPKNSRKEDSHN